MNLKFVAAVVAFIVLVVGLFALVSAPADAHHNRSKIVKKVRIPSKEFRDIQVPQCVTAVIVTSRGRHVTKGLDYEPSYNSVRIHNRRSRDVIARLACGRR